MCQCLRCLGTTAMWADISYGLLHTWVPVITLSRLTQLSCQGLGLMKGDGNYLIQLYVVDFLGLSNSPPPGSLYSQGRETHALWVRFIWPVLDGKMRMSWIMPSIPLTRMRAEDNHPTQRYLHCRHLSSFNSSLPLCLICCCDCYWGMCRHNWTGIELDVLVC